MLLKDAYGNLIESKENRISENAIYGSVEAAIISSSTAVLFIKLSQVSSQSKLSIPPVRKVQAMFACCHKAILCGILSEKAPRAQIVYGLQCI